MADGDNDSGVQQLSDGGPDGATFGSAITEKISAYGVTTITQPASSSQAIVAEGGSAVAACTIIACVQSLGLANKALINEIRANLMSLGFIKGAA